MKVRIIGALLLAVLHERGSTLSTNTHPTTQSLHTQTPQDRKQEKEKEHKKDLFCPGAARAASSQS